MSQIGITDHERMVIQMTKIGDQIYNQNIEHQGPKEKNKPAYFRRILLPE